MAVLGLLLSLSAAASQYTYDAQGRLKTVTDANNETAEYVYDAAGNLLQVKRYAATELAITSFAPASGPVGTVVTVNGSGFAAQPSSNQVTINGVAATVSAATLNSLSVTVPVGATSGHIGVTANAQTVQSDGNFTVTSSDGRPTISDFTPKCTTADQTISVTGTNFDTRQDATRVEVGDRLAKATIASSTTLTFVAPRLSTGGKIKVTTPAGTAESAVSLMLSQCGGAPPSTTLQIDAAYASISMQAQQPTILYFQGQRDQWVSLQFSDLNPSSSGVSLYFAAPDGSQLTAASLGGNSGGSYHMPPLPMSGIYMMRLIASTATTANIRLQSAVKLTADGPGFQLTNEAYQSYRFAFDVDRPSALGIGVSPFSGNSEIFAYAPRTGDSINGTGSVGTCNNNGPGCHLNMPMQLEPGVYAVMWRPSVVGATANGTLWLSNDSQVELQPGISRQVALSRPGQNARLRFQGTAGSGVSLNIAGLQLSSGATDVNVYVFDPSGTQIKTQTVSGNGAMVTLANLPTTGTYTVLVDPSYAATGSFEATLDPGTPWVVGGSALHFASDKGGKGYRVVIDGVAKQKLGIGILHLTTEGSNGVVYAKIYSPSGVLFGSRECHVASPAYPGCEINLGPLLVTGRYAITFEPPGNATGSSMDVMVSDDVEMSINEEEQRVTIDAEGGNARLTFHGAPGAGKTIAISEVNNTAAVVTVLRPDSAVLMRAPLLNNGVLLSTVIGQFNQAAHFSIGDFPIEGTYTAFVDPLNAGTMAFKAQLGSGVDVPQGQGNVVHMGSVAGPWARSGFSGAEGEKRSVGVELTAMTGYANHPLTTTVFDPDLQPVYASGASSAALGCNTTCDFDLPPLPVSGPYTTLVELPTDDPTKSEVSISSSADLIINGTTGTFDLDPRGRNGWLVFNGTAGHVPTLTLTRLSATGANQGIAYTLYSPTGASFVSGVLDGNDTSHSWTTTALPATGTYLLFIDPDNGNKAQVTATVTSP